MNQSATRIKRRRNEGNCLSQDDEQVTGSRRGRPPYQITIESLTGADWNYLLGLYFADGNRNRQYEVKFCLQGDEGDIAGRVAELFKRIGLSPHIAYGESGKDDIIVRAYSTRLVERFPNKKILKNNADVRTRFFEHQMLSTIENGVPFLAGLLDGDGCCPVTFRKRSGIRGEIDRWGWSFRQTRLPFIFDYIVTFVNFLAPDGLRVTSGQGGKRTIRFRKSATVALLDAGLATYSWKAAHWIDKIRKLEKHLAEYLTTGEIARTLNVSDFLVRKWISAGKLECCRSSNTKMERKWKYVSKQALERFWKDFKRQANIVDSEKRDSTRFIDVAKMLGISYSKLYKLYRQGWLKATLVHDRGPVHTYLVMQCREMKRVVNMFSKEREGIKSKGTELRELATILGIKPNSLYAAYRRGEFKARLVREYSGKGCKRLVIPRGEVNRIKRVRKAEERSATALSIVP